MMHSARHSLRGWREEKGFKKRCQIVNFMYGRTRVGKNIEGGEKGEIVTICRGPGRGDQKKFKYSGQTQQQLQNAVVGKRGGK